MAFEVEATSELVMSDGRPLGIMNSTGVAIGDIAGSPEVKGLVREISRWVDMGRSNGPRGSMFDRSLYLPPDQPYEQMRAARHALRTDDIVGGVADVTESVAFAGGLKWESSDPDEADVFNQLSADLNLDNLIRTMWRENFCVDQFVAAKVWGYTDYTVRGRTRAGNKRKKSFRVWVPQAVVLLNSEYVLPIGTGPLRADRLAWMANDFEVDRLGLTTPTGQHLDPLMNEFFINRYRPTPDEEVQLVHWGVRGMDGLLEMNPDMVFRHCHTKPDYAMFPDLRLRAVFPLLDLKRQLMASDRAALVGSANYILLIRKGSDAAPASQSELDNLKAGYNFLAKLPVIISDHRLEIDVIAPKLDFVLRGEAYDLLDARILARTVTAFTPPASRSVDPASWNDLIATSIQNRRHMIARTLEKQIGRAIVQHPLNAGIFESRPSLVFTPRTVSIGVNDSAMAALLALRTQREVSRDTILEYVGLDQSTEAQRMELEDEIYDEIFKTRIPFAAPGAGGPAGTGDSGRTPNATPEAPTVSGGRGGRPRGGGQSNQSPQAQSKPRTRTGNPSTQES